MTRQLLGKYYRLIVKHNYSEKVEEKFNILLLQQNIGYVVRDVINNYFGFGLEEKKTLLLRLIVFIHLNEIIGVSKIINEIKLL